MKAFKKYPFYIPADGSITLFPEGSYFRILESTGPLSVTVDTVGELGPILAGQGLRNVPFKRLELRDSSGSDNAGFLVVADGDFVDDRITGEVSVINVSRQESLTNQTFLGYGSSGAIGGNLSYIYLYNHGATGKNIFLEKFHAINDLGGFHIGVFQGPPANIVTNQWGKSKLLGGDDSLGQVFGAFNDADLIFPEAMYFQVPLGVTFFYEFTSPVVIRPDYSFVIRPSEFNSGITASFEWTEKPL